jgi:hypothetical protein
MRINQHITIFLYSRNKQKVTTQVSFQPMITDVDVPSSARVAEALPHVPNCLGPNSYLTVHHSRDRPFMMRNLQLTKPWLATCDNPLT